MLIYIPEKCHVYNQRKSQRLDVMCCIVMLAVQTLTQRYILKQRLSLENESKNLLKIVVSTRCLLYTSEKCVN